MPSKDYANTRYSPLDQITVDNVKDLKAAWTFSTGALRGHEGQPLVVGNMMYVESAFPNHLYAIDLNNVGKIAWQYTPTQNPAAAPVACCDLVNRGPAYADGRIVEDALDGHVIALDAKTGKVLWNANNADPALGQTLTSAPLIIHNKVIVGVSGGEYGVLGHVTAYDLSTGKRLWRAYSAGPDSQILLDSSFKGPRNAGVDTWKIANGWKFGGGTTWGWYSYDPNLNLFYYGTGNPGTWNPTQRPGDNKWSMTIFARNPDTGKAVWAYQMTPHDGWDYDGVNECILADMDVNGTKTPVLVHFDRNGFAYVLDRRNGKLIAAHKFDPSVNWATGVNMQTGRPDVVPAMMTRQGYNTKNICPASIGSKDEQPAAYDAKSGLFLVPTNHWCEDYQPFAVKYKAGFPFVGALVRMYNGPGGYGGRFIAFNALTGETAWAINDTFPDWGGALATAGGLAFYGTMTGWLRAVDIKTGKVLWQFKCPSGIIGNVISYMHDNKQYVAVYSGVGGWAGIGIAAGLKDPTAGLGAVGAGAALPQYTNLGGTLMVFSL